MVEVPDTPFLDTPFLEERPPSRALRRSTLQGDGCAAGSSIRSRSIARQGRARQGPGRNGLARPHGSVAAGLGHAELRRPRRDAEPGGPLVRTAGHHQRCSGDPVHVVATTDRVRRSGVQISMDSEGRYMDTIFTARLWRTPRYWSVCPHTPETRSRDRAGVRKRINSPFTASLTTPLAADHRRRFTP